MKLEDLIPNPNNPREITQEKIDKLAVSITKFEKMMLLRPIIIDENNVILGGNMRYKALKSLGYETIPKGWVKKASNLSDDEKRQFIIKDNVGFGNWDFELLAIEWELTDLQNWGLDVPDTDFLSMDDMETSEEFSLPDGEKEPFQQMTFTVADVQAETIKEALSEAKDNNTVESFGNENGNGNALYRIILEWAEQRK